MTRTMADELRALAGDLQSHVDDDLANLQGVVRYAVGELKRLADDDKMEAGDEHAA